jgi:hypothetical protein
MSEKYPKTPHLPFSPGVFSDDITLDSKHCNQFLNKEVVITEKLDGGNCQLHQGKGFPLFLFNSVYARTNSKEATHESFGPIKQLYSSFSWNVPDDLALYGENMVGIHSIEYSGLENYFYLFGALKDGKEWTSWDEIVKMSKEFEIPHGFEILI